MSDEQELYHAADKMAADYLAHITDRPVFPGPDMVAQLEQLGGALPTQQNDPHAVLDMLSRIGGAATTATNGPNYFGFVIGALLPIAGAAERIALAWDQCASSHVNSPAMAAIEKTAGQWLLEILDLPRDTAVGFGTSATACGFSALAAAQTYLLRQSGWDLDRSGLRGAPPVRIVVPDTVHVTVKKAIRLLGFGTRDIVTVQTDDFGRMRPDALPHFDALTVLCLQAGDVNTGEFDRFSDIIPTAKAAGAWVHVDGAFGLWARASQDKRSSTDGVELADSWTTDGHKTLNTAYDSAVTICRHADLLASTMNAEAAYAPSETDAQKNLTLEFSRRAHGLGFWAVLQTLGRSGVGSMVDGYCALATQLAEGCREAGVTVLNRVVFNQVLCQLADPADTPAFLKLIEQDNAVWFGPTMWRGQPAFRLSVSSWRTDEDAIRRALDAIGRALHQLECQKNG
ncbi:pyridoxal phosphate-dependent decarboxylase family protein [Parvularcula sp. LCG005]|uniref:pyridoxal phosphate-dependent decarboxylase family protein n=1 Tax=Parvularcula sp. LCG005 TaxID=3078805 RepID=UPI0029426B3A|nr:pyridoxal-dependent decarboxylase [Parvularcula sp. LCG005]WOI52166.1 pyridoxal-dependent decarboxylase [Parvularcula sp. LCG005]